MNTRITLGIPRAAEGAYDRYEHLNDEAAFYLRCAITARPEFAAEHIAEALALAADAVGTRLEARALRREQCEIDAALDRWSA